MPSYNFTLHFAPMSSRHWTHKINIPELNGLTARRLDSLINKYRTEAARKAGNRCTHCNGWTTNASLSSKLHLHYKLFIQILVYPVCAEEECMLAVEMEKQKDAAEMEMQDPRVRAIANLEAY
jgi:hypothetical protein